MNGHSRYRVLFLCTGNICRSPLAEGVLRHMLDAELAGRVDVASAGVAAMPGQPASTNGVMACAELGVDISGHRARMLTRDLIETTDLVLAMEEHHRMAAVKLAPREAGKIHLLSQYAAGSEGNAPIGVDDPIGGDLDEYRSTLREIRRYIEQALPRIREAVRERAVES